MSTVERRRAAGARSTGSSTEQPWVWSAGRRRHRGPGGIVYAWDRSAYTFGFLWRGFQADAPQPAIDIAGSLVFHPTEMIVQTLLQLGITVIVLLRASLPSGEFRPHLPHSFETFAAPGRFLP